jgi:hypothetical protein
MTKDEMMRAKEQGQTKFECMSEMVARLNAGDEEAREEIWFDALSVQVRSGWYVPGRDAGKPKEFEILLCTGGPAVRLVGALDEHGEPQSVAMEVQDWFQPWMTFHPLSDADTDEILLTYARCFNFCD